MNMYDSLSAALRATIEFCRIRSYRLKSNRTNKTNNQNPFERILTTDKIRSNGI